MVSTDIQHKHANSKGNCVGSGRIESFHRERPQPFHGPQKKIFPWDSGMFWAGISISVTAVCAVLWLLVSGAQVAFKSDWVVKPATVNQIDDVQKTVKELERRQQKSDDRIEKIYQTLERLTENSAITAEAAKQANATAKETSQKVDNLLISSFVHGPPQYPSPAPVKPKRPQAKVGQR